MSEQHITPERLAAALAAFEQMPSPNTDDRRLQRSVIQGIGGHWAAGWMCREGETVFWISRSTGTGPTMAEAMENSAKAMNAYAVKVMSEV